MGTAVKATASPSHEGLEPEVTEILTVGAPEAFTVIVMELDVTEFAGHPPPSGAITQVITSLSARVVEVKVFEFIPTLPLPTFH